MDGIPGSLDPSAREFHPTPYQNPTFINSLTFFPPPPPPPLFLPYHPPFAPPPPTYFHPLATLLPPPDYAQSSTPTPAPPSRSLLLTYVPVSPHLTEAIVRAELEVFGEVRAVEMERAYERIVTVHFYDLRDSQAALREIRAQHMNHQRRIPPFSAPGFIAGCPVWAEFIIPTKLNIVPDGLNHGTIVIFNLDSNIPPATLKNIFEAFGTVKEVRDTPSKRHQKFLEYFDVRDAARAAREMNGKMIYRKQITIDFSRPGGHGRRWSTSSNNSRIPKHSSNQCQSYFRQQQASQSSRKPVRSNSCTTPKSNVFPAASTPAPPRSHPCQARRPTKTTATNVINNIIGSSSSISNGGEYSMSNVVDADHENDAALEKVFTGCGSGNKLIRSLKKRGKGLDWRFRIKEEDVITTDYCGDSRTTVMIKNIPNKYSQKLLLSLLDNHCAHCNDQILGDVKGEGSDQACLSSYDFVYLPMDFNNKCNVGYGFVNMTSPEATIRLYKAFHLQSWEVFNSRKICEVTYARVQGLQALKEHFRNSKFPSGSDEIFPVVFEPPRDGRRQLTPPQPIYGLAASSENGSSCRSSVGSDESRTESERCADHVVEEEVIAELRIGEQVKH
ncbi:unnamed protein product [Rhodiola kirilowii]